MRARLDNLRTSSSTPVAQQTQNETHDIKLVIRDLHLPLETGGVVYIVNNGDMIFHNGKTGAATCAACRSNTCTTPPRSGPWPTLRAVLAPTPTLAAKPAPDSGLSDAGAARQPRPRLQPDAPPSRLPPCRAGHVGKLLFLAARHAAVVRHVRLPLQVHPNYLTVKTSFVEFWILKTAACCTRRKSSGTGRSQPDRRQHLADRRCSTCQRRVATLWKSINWAGHVHGHAGDVRAQLRQTAGAARRGNVHGGAEGPRRRAGAAWRTRTSNSTRRRPGRDAEIADKTQAFESGLDEAADLRRHAGTHPEMQNIKVAALQIIQQRRQGSIPTSARRS